MSNHIMSTDEIKEFLTSNTFIPHEKGNIMMYGLNSFGSESIIQYNNDIWKFIWYTTGTRDAVYMNKEGEYITINPYNNDNNNSIIQMIKSN